MRRVAHSTGLGGSISANDIVKETRVVDQINVSTPLNLAFNVDSLPLLSIRADAGSTVIKLICYQYDLEADNISVDGSTLTISGWNQTVYGIPASAFNGTHTIIRGEASNYYDPPEYQHTDEVVFDIRVINNLPYGTHKYAWLNTTSSFHVADRGFTTPVTCTWSISKVNTFTNKLPTHDAIVNHVSTAISTALTNYTGNSAANVIFASVTTDYIRLDPVSIADGNSTFDGLGVKNSNGTTLKPIIVSDVYITDRGVWVSASLDNKLDTPAGTPSINDVVIYNGSAWEFVPQAFVFDTNTSIVRLNPNMQVTPLAVEVPKVKFSDTSLSENTFRKFKTTKDEILADNENSPISCQSYTDCAANAVFASSHVNGYHLLSPSASNIHAHLTANYMPLITGGSNGDVLTTDGAGNLSFSALASGGSLSTNHVHNGSLEITSYQTVTLTRLQYSLISSYGWWVAPPNLSNATPTVATNLSLKLSSGCYAQTYYTSSDDRKKHHEVKIPNATELIAKLQPYVYEKTEKLYADGSTRPESDTDYMIEAGYIAQDVLQIDELAFAVRGGDYVDKVTGDNVTQEYSLDYQSLFVIATKAIQELSLRVSQLEARNT